MRRIIALLGMCLLIVACASTPTARSSEVPTVAPVFVPLVAQKDGPQVRLTVKTAQPLSEIGYPFWGVNYVAFWDDIQGSATSLQAMKHTGVQVLRFPGGEPANWLDWSRPAEPPYWTTTSTDELAAYAEALGAQLLLQTNPTTNEISDDGQVNDPAPEQAAGWVAYTSEHNIAAPFWEIGNEPDLHLTKALDWEGMQWYIDAFNAQAAAMRAANPAIRIFGPVGTNSYQWWALGSLDMFLARTGNKQGSGMLDGVSLHYYYAQGCAEWERVRDAGQSWAPNMAQIQKVIAEYDTRPLPVFISETNAAVGGLNCPINKTMASALANADLLGAYRASGVQAVQLFGTIHAAEGWGFLYGSNEDRPAETPTPTYFILPIWTQSGTTVLDVVGSDDPAATLSAYASRNENGDLQVVLINKTAADLTVALGFEDVDPTGGLMQVYELKPLGGDINARDVIYNGVEMPDVTADSLPPPATVGIADATITRALPAYSLTLLNIQGPGAVDGAGR